MGVFFRLAQSTIMNSGGGEQLGVGAFSEVGLVQTLDGGGVAADIVPPTVLRITNDGRRVVSPQNSPKTTGDTFSEHWRVAGLYLDT